MLQGGYRCGVGCDIQVHRDGGQVNGQNNQNDEEVCGWVFPGFGG